MSDQKTIDRVCVELAELAIRQREFCRRRYYHPGETRDYPSFQAIDVLLRLFDISTENNGAGGSALESHDGTPEQLVQALRELAVKEEGSAIAPEPLGQGICVICGGEMSFLTPEMLAEYGVPNSPGGWIHNGPAKDHAAKLSVSNAFARGLKRIENQPE